MKTIGKQNLKYEIFEHGVFTQIRPVRVGDLGTRPKIQKTMAGALNLNFYRRIFFSEKGYYLRDVKKVLFLCCFWIHFNRSIKILMEFLLFMLFKIGSVMF
jgi:hypothetical protein